MNNSSALPLLIAVIVAIACIAIAITGRPGSILGALIDAHDMELSSGGGAVQGF